MTLPTASPIIRVELLGGLGNQLFQAATGFALARRLGGALELDTARFREGAGRSFALDGLRHGATIIGDHGSGLARTWRRIRRAITPSPLRRPVGWSGAVFREASYAYDPRIEAIAGDCHLVGYFHSARYFAAEAAAVRTAFDLGAIATPRAREIAATLSPNALAVHVRIGDFAAQSKFSRVHGTLGEAYYRNAIALALAARPVDEVFLFSDTPEAARAVMPAGASYKLMEGFSAADDLFLMSQAAHHVIANSTFSWWSAWLAPRADSLVIAPRAWLAPEALKKTYIGDLYPEGWVLV